MLTFPPRIFLYTDSLMPCAAPRGSLFMAPRAADTNSGLTSIRALRMSFCKAFWVLGFVDRADSNIFRCSMITASFASNWNIHYSDHSPPGVYCTRKSRPAHHCEGRRKLNQFTAEIYLFKMCYHSANRAASQIRRLTSPPNFRPPLFTQRRNCSCVCHVGIPVSMNFFSVEDCQFFGPQL